MKRLVSLVGVAILGAVVFSTPPRATACTDCGPTFREAIARTPSIVLAEWRRTTRPGMTFYVIDVLKGPPVDKIHLYGTRLYGRKPHGRWIMFGGYEFKVSARGVVTNPAEGSAGAILDYPRTLAGWYAAVRALPDTAARPLVSGSTAPEPPTRWLAVAVVLGVLIGLRRFNRHHGPGVAPEPGAHAGAQAAPTRGCVGLRADFGARTHSPDDSPARGA